jgi:proline iminopeptidase
MTFDLTRRAAVHGLAATTLAACSQVESGSLPAIAEQTGYVEVPGGRVWWMRAGSGPKTPLLLLHGGPGAGHNYLLPLRALADERPVIFYDQLGGGRSDAPEDESLYTVARSVEELDAVRNALGLDRIVLFGNSWGAMLAIEYFVTCGSPGVERLVLSGAAASGPQTVAGMRRLIDALPNGAGVRMKELEAAGQQQSSEYQSLVELFYRRHFCRAQPWPPEVLATADNVSRSPAYKIMWGPNEFTATGPLKDWERRSDLGALRVPTLLTTGQHDEVTLDCHTTILEQVPGSQLLVFEGCSHLTMNEKPMEYVRALRAFIT